MIIFILETKKTLFYVPKGHHVVKVLTFTDMRPKVQGLLPLSRSFSPTCGDQYILQKKAADEALSAHQQNYIRTMLAGNSQFFVILIMGTGI